ncbi:unnamed protein product [Echinostoma caproni]|uniref:Uncharacterized protein n=1 Tax=Echinostoma caproni TaxID=27848 RepID=A0A183B6Z2_9TREM|nr:unnamed protein product [Echinostoma caproni]
MELSDCLSVQPPVEKLNGHWKQIKEAMRISMKTTVDTGASSSTSAAMLDARRTQDQGHAAVFRLVLLYDAEI